METIPAQYFIPIMVVVIGLVVLQSWWLGRRKK